MKNRSLAPADFHKFQHRTKLFENPKRHESWTVPLWIVGVSPFDSTISSEDGYVVHLAEPHFTARWVIGEALNPERHGKAALYDEELNISIYEVSYLHENNEDIQSWILEAVCAVAYSKGMLGELEPPNSH